MTRAFRICDCVIMVVGAKSLRMISTLACSNDGLMFDVQQTAPPCGVGIVGDGALLALRRR